MPLRIGNEKLSKNIKYKDQQNIKFNAFSVYDDRYIKTKTKTYGDKVYNSFRGLNVPKDRTECESVTVIFINSLLAYANKHYLQVTLDSFV